MLLKHSNIPDALSYRILAPFCSLSSATETFDLARALFQSAHFKKSYAAIIVVELCRKGSYTSPLTQSRCSKTANFRATATAALFFAFFRSEEHTSELQ